MLESLSRLKTKTRNILRFTALPHLLCRGGDRSEHSPGLELDYLLQQRLLVGVPNTSPFPVRWYTTPQQKNGQKTHTLLVVRSTCETLPIEQYVYILHMKIPPRRNAYISHVQNPSSRKKRLQSTCKNPSHLEECLHLTRKNPSKYPITRSTYNFTQYTYTDCTRCSVYRGVGKGSPSSLVIRDAKSQFDSTSSEPIA